jgi:glycosyltransferase involved in cell wall biosynthesis
MKILIDGSLLRGSRTGSFNYLSNLLKHLVLQKSEDCYFLLDYPQNFQILELPKFEKIELLPLIQPSFYLQNKNSSKSLLEKIYNRAIPTLADFLYSPVLRRKADRIVSGMEVYHVQENGLFHNTSGATVITIHDITTLTHPHLHLASNCRFHEKKITFAERYADIVIASSENTAADLLRYTSIHKERIRVVYMGIDPEIIHLPAEETTRALLERFQLNNMPFILGLGTLEPRKNWVASLKVFQLLRSKHDTLKMVIAGAKGWLAEDFLNQVEIHPYRKDIILPGFVSVEEKMALLSSCSVFLFPSLYEGFGIPVLEAMQCQAPVVCSKISSLMEVAGEGALLTDPDAYEDMATYCDQLISNPAYRQQRIDAGLKWVKRFNWRGCAEQVAEVYSEAKMLGYRQ